MKRRDRERAMQLSILLERPTDEREQHPELDELARVADLIAARWSSVEVPANARDRARVPSPPTTRPDRRWAPMRRLALGAAAACALVAAVFVALNVADDGLDRAGIIERAEAAITPRAGIVHTRLRFVTRTVSGSGPRLRGRVSIWSDEEGRSHLVVRALDGRLAADIAILPGRVEAYTAPDNTIRVTDAPGEVVAPLFGGALLTPEALRGRLGEAEVSGPFRRGQRRVYELLLDRPPAEVPAEATGSTVYVVDATTYEPVAIRARVTAGDSTTEANVTFETYRVLGPAAEDKLELLPHPGARRLGP